MNKIRIGVMGCANIAERYMIPAINALEEFKLVAVASRTQETAQKFAEKFNCEAIVGYQSLLEREDIDAIYLPLPTGLHNEWINKSLDAGKHILAEKSLGIDFHSTKAMVEKAQEKKLLLMENFQFQYHSQHNYVKKLLTSGEIGEMRSFRASFGFPPLAWNNFRYNAELGGGSLLDAGSYMLKVSQFFLGSDLEVKAADLVYDEELKVDLYGTAYLTNGKLSSQVAWGFDNFYQCNYEIWGSKGKLSCERAYSAPPGFSPKIIIEKQGLRTEILLDSDNHFENILKYFRHSILEQKYEHHFKEILTQARLIEQVKLKTSL
ncbi:Gfo/Idh/MocA family oxidoreductase [Tolypothrix campylonemoides VB511288]|nr:Gfo/Idh/MocA family oxidoreductase [Tolypothrix campylonemoides VB511288]